MVTAPRLAAALVATLALLSGAGSAIAAPTTTEYPIPSHDHAPRGIVAGPDGALWFAQDAGGGGIGRSTTAGSISEFSSGGIGTAEGIALGPDGNLWFTEPSEEAVVRLTPSGTAKEFALNKGLLSELFTTVTPAGIASGPDGNLWFTIASNPAGIGRITTEGTGTVFSSGLSASSKPQGITLGPDGNLWFTETANPAKIGRITASGTITEFSTGLTANSQPQSITAGPDGNLWFTESADPGRIGRITPTGTITQFTTGLTTNSQPEGIAAADDGNIYFTEFKGTGRIGKITPSGTITEYATPTSNSQPEQIAPGPDGNLWFTENGNHGQIARITVAPSVGETTASAVSEQTAGVQAPIGANSQATSYLFEYGTTTAYGAQTTSSSAGSAASPAPVTANLSGLAPAMLYHVRAVATNAAGTTYGPDQTFSTTLPPDAFTDAATGVSLTGATLAARVNPQGQPTTYHFDWGLTTAYGARVPASDLSVGSDTSEHSLEQGLTGLAPDTAYHFRVVASNCGGCAEGTSYGQDQTFTTAPAPDAETKATTAVSATSATVAGSVNPRGAPTDYYFEWGQTSSYGNRADGEEGGVGADSTAHEVSQELTDLAPGTSYHYRLVATNCSGCVAGTSYGSDMVFTSESLPVSPQPVQDAPPALLLTSAPVTALSPIAPITPGTLPALGQTAQLRVLSGQVLVRLPGATASQPLSDITNLPLGSVIDVTHGVIDLSTATDQAGHTQSVTLWGASFIARQATAPPGMTTLTLLAPPACARHQRRPHAASASSAAASRSRGTHGLWAKDNHGHFSTRGQNSVATVRGTFWETVERCGGTFTRVRQGVVSVRDLHRHRTVLVRAGHSYLAKR
ncbi:MAG TPA: hypothetical protein VMB05_05880 [Solirubrobacteraceae bacterium]|nr:hypothetical protein [Solirubrobacteraceae bacterium]